MSHIASVAVALKDLKILEQVCRETRVPVEIKPQKVKLYSASVKAVACLKLPGWAYPVAVQANGAVLFDNYDGKWGDMKELNRLLQSYSVAVVIQQARRMGRAVRRKDRPDGTVVIQMKI